MEFVFYLDYSMKTVRAQSSASYKCMCRPMLNYSFLKFLCCTLLSTFHNRDLEPSLQTFSKLLQFYLFFNLLIGF